MTGQGGNSDQDNSEMTAGEIAGITDGGDDEDPQDVQGTEKPGITNDSEEFEDNEERIDENIERGQSEFTRTMKRSKAGAEKMEEGHNLDEDLVEEIEEVIQSSSTELEDENEEFQGYMNDVTSEVLDVKEEFENETVPSWNDEVSYDTTRADEIVGREGDRGHVGSVLDGSFKDSVVDLGYFTGETLDWNGLIAFKNKTDSNKGIDADKDLATTAKNRGNRAADDIEENKSHLKEEVKWLVDAIDIDSQMSNLQTRIDTYEEVKEETDESLEKYEGSKDHTDPDTSEGMFGAIRNALSYADGDSEFESEEHRLQHLLALNANKEAHAVGAADQISRARESIKRLEEIEGKLQDEKEKYEGVSDSLEIDESYDEDEFDGLVGEETAEVLKQEFDSWLEIAELDSGRELEVEFEPKDWEDRGMPQQIENNSQEIYEASRDFLKKKAEEIGLANSGRRYEEFADESYEDGMIRKVAGIATNSDRISGEIDDLIDLIPDTEGYSEEVEESRSYLQEELDEVVEDINENLETAKELDLPNVERFYRDEVKNEELEIYQAVDSDFYQEE